MNIGSLIRGLLGEQKPGDVKALELKPGQVVRGVVMNVSDDGQEAVVQIQGVQVKAKLETPLRAGETALLLVQPPGEGGTAVLKPLSQMPGQPLSPSSMSEVLEFAGLPDTKENREMIRSMQQAGVPLTKEHIASFKEAMMAKPPQVPAAEWAESVAIAFHRGLPVTAESVRGLHQAVFGPQLHQLLQSLEGQLAHALQGGTAAGGPAGAGSSPLAAPPAAMPSHTQGPEPAPSAQAGAAQGSAAAGSGVPAGQAQAVGPQALLTKLQSLLHQLRGELAQLPAHAAQPAAAPAAGHAAAPAATAAAPGEGAAGPSPKPPTPGAEPWVGRLLKLLGAEHEQQALRGAGSSPAGEAARAASAAQPGGQQAAALPGSGGPAAGGSAGAAGPAAGAVAGQAPAGAVAGQAPGTGGLAAAAPGGQAPAAAGAAASPSAARPDGVGVGVGLAPASHPAASQAPAPGVNGQGPASNRVQTSPQLQAPAAGIAPAGAAGESPAALQDSLKGVLLQVIASPDTPPALKEAAQQIVQHLTGQQLLLNTDRTAPFAQVTMFIPLHGPGGEQTASVHIQSRRGRKGELDATNCRLLFDLDMKHLGHTLIDVQVVDRIVSLSFRNNQEWTAELFQAMRQELASGIASIGYQLLSVKTEPMPEGPQQIGEQAVQGTAADYTPQAYKGVDMRI
ncbi:MULTISPECIES: hypothetical protein [Paenibacillus]|uniref:hypothetical protein n=1 Tax=Paenibacillus TaxID=44249 RepID=UPI00119D1DAF|nr:hypothetical protein [Paenibacillus sp. IHBB 10380]